MVRLVLPFFVFLVFIAFVHGQDQLGFISIDCGLPENSSYADLTTGIIYVSDAEYIETGVSKTISPQYKTNVLKQQFFNVRSFPQGIKNCYTLIPPQHKGRHRYFIRARFMYGNYDNKNQIPTFDIYLGVNYWLTVDILEVTDSVFYEILHVPSSNYTYFCLVNTGYGTPFISVLELRLVDDDIYVTQSGSLELIGRYNLRSFDNKVSIRYGDDIFDRIWRPSFLKDGVSELSTSLTIATNSFELPPVVIGTAITMQNASAPLEFYYFPWDPKAEHYFFMHFADFQFNQSREFHVFMNELDLSGGPFKPVYLTTDSVYTKDPAPPTPRYNFSLIKTANSTLPPILNAFEMYTLKKFLYQESDQHDVDAIKSVKSVYGLKKNWQGDPCTPKAYSWEGLTCINDNSTRLRIIHLNLSSSGLTGNISTAIFDLKLLQSLDLSNNNLTGEVPDFLSKMKNLTVLKLSRNNLTGIVPAELTERSKSRSLWLSIAGNPNLCMSESCKINHKNKRISAIAASVAVVLVLLIAFFISWVFIQKRRKQQRARKVVQVTNLVNFQGKLVDSTNRQFTYSEVLAITNNLASVIGKGGFGLVYRGYLEGTEVAVKMLSLSSLQGYKEFCTEIEFLTRIHHKNLTSLVGFCDEGNNIGLIYEYMANGNLKEHLSDHNVPSWKERLRIALDAATGLEYLHNGCKPPIIHRDVKTANILLNEKFEAKLADFGLSKAVPVDRTHVSTAVVGTLGYLDPEYYISYKLNEKSDVFSFGVVLLEIITSRAVITRDIENAHIRKWVSYMLETTEGDVTSIVDTRLGGDFEVNSVKKATEIALACASPISNQRPTMSHVVAELKQSLLTELDRVNEGRKFASASFSEGTSLNFDTESSLVGR